MIIIIDTLNWTIIYLLLIWQKIGPLLLLSNQYNQIIIVFLIIRILVGSLIGINQSSLKKIMTYSSINQLSWIIIRLVYIIKFFKLYLFIYIYIIFFTIYSFKFFNLYYIYNFFNLKFNLYLQIIIFTNILSLGGLPPFIGFFPKIIIINIINNTLLIFIIIIFTIITLFYYIRIIQSTIIINILKLYIIYKTKFNSLNLIIKLSLLRNLLLIIILLLY